MEVNNEDITLIEGFLSGDKASFDKIVKKYQQRIYYLALRMVNNHHDAEEIAQESFLRTYKGLKHLREKKYFFTWLYRITLNLCLTKKSEKKNILSLDGFFGLRDTKAEHHVRKAEKEQVKEKIKKAMDNLPKQQKAVFVLRIYENRKFKDIADVMGLSVGGVKSNYFNAVTKIKEMLEELL